VNDSILWVFSHVFGLLSPGIPQQIFRCSFFDRFKTQRNYHFFSSSILLLYESCSDDAHPSVKMVDFAHVFTGPDGVDENFMKGLDSLLNILQEITPEF
jgi:hypothetical protein